MIRRPKLAFLFIGLLALVVAVPVLAAKPSAPPGQAKEKADKTQITLNGTIETSTDASGEATYRLADGGKTYTLNAGPAWFFGDAYPLKQYVGKSVTVVGEVEAGATDVDVLSVDGVALREPGKPPWAGGWKRVGSMHPGWSQAKADHVKAKFGDCFPPGKCKDKSGRPDKADKPEGSDDPDEAEESEAP